MRFVLRSIICDRRSTDQPVYVASDVLASYAVAVRRRAANQTLDQCLRKTFSLPPSEDMNVVC